MSHPGRSCRSRSATSSARSLLGHLFDAVGRRFMITLSYVGSGVLLVGTAILFDAGLLDAFWLTACWMVVFFFASAGASAPT